ncbi:MULTISPECIES: hypothetical protein [unclassified Fusibacter]|uniref:hypothetical protein n=1 Tax=unclassified Fusibacter TaxID=2624464 RepID=UPI0010104C44|nr:MULTISPECIES: hypothetical protein [unclassified Fusibacter]MCK8059365.1 hypothetical protein [Fusibacter sp. A2]NPE21171.1 hypothetical protein [Fusibacter sp. A1]RXV62439.1 hypothetical protein DWB64_04995 [Fusibacter sp. A1]
MKKLFILLLTICVMAGCSAQGEAIPLAERDPNVFMIAYYQGQGYQLDNFVQDFINEMDPEVEVVLEKYEGLDFETFKSRLYNSFLTGTEPDIIICGPQLDIPFLASKGYLHDLSDTGLLENIHTEFYDSENPYFIMNMASPITFFNSTQLEKKDRLKEPLPLNEFVDYIKAFKLEHPEFHVFLGGDSKFTAAINSAIGEMPSIKRVIINDFLISDLSYLVNDKEALFLCLEQLKYIFSPDVYKYYEDVERVYDNPNLVRELYTNVALPTHLNNWIGIGSGLDLNNNDEHDPVGRMYGEKSKVTYKYGDYISISKRSVLKELAVSFTNHYLKYAPYDDFSFGELRTLSADKERDKAVLADIKAYPTLWVTVEDYNTYWQMFKKQNTFYFETGINKLVHEEVNRMLLNNLEAKSTAEEIINKINLYQLENK